MSEQTLLNRPVLVPLNIVEGLFRRRRFIIVTFSAIFLSAAAAAFLMPQRYTAEMKFLVNNTRPDLIVTTAPDIDIPRPAATVSEADINTEIELLNSADILRSVVSDTGLVHTIKPKPGESNDHQAERAVERLRKDLSIADAHRSNVILVRYAARKPEMAVQVLRSLAQEFTNHGLQLRQSSGAAKVFSEQAERYRDELAEAHRELAAFHESRSLSGIQQQMELVVNRVMTTERDLAADTASIDELSADAHELAAQIVKEGDTVRQTKRIPNQNETEHLSALLMDLQNQRATLLDKYKPNDRSIADLDKQISTTASALERAKAVIYAEETVSSNPVAQQLRTDLAQAKSRQAAVIARRNALLGSLQSDRNQLNGYEEATLAEANLQQAVKQSQENYELYSHKGEEARISALLDSEKIANVVLAENPVAQSTATFPNKALFLSFGFLLAIAFSFGGALLAELVSGALYTPAEIERRTGIPVLSTFPAPSQNQRTRVAA